MCISLCITLTIVEVKGLEPMNPQEGADLQSAAIATMRYFHITIT